MSEDIWEWSDWLREMKATMTYFASLPAKRPAIEFGTTDDPDETGIALVVNEQVWLEAHLPSPSADWEVKFVYGQRMGYLAWGKATFDREMLLQLNAKFLAPFFDPTELDDPSSEAAKLFIALGADNLRDLSAYVAEWALVLDDVALFNVCVNPWTRAIIEGGQRYADLVDLRAATRRALDLPSAAVAPDIRARLTERYDYFDDALRSS